MHPEVSVHRRAVRGIATGHNPGGKLHCPGDILFHIVEAAVLVDNGGVCRNMLRLFTRQVSAGIQRVNSDVEEWTATRKLLAQPPLTLSNVEAESALNGLYLAEGTITNELNCLQIG